MARKKWIPPISVNVNMANRNLYMYGHLKLQTEFCLFGGARGPPWAPRLEGKVYFRNQHQISRRLKCHVTYFEEHQFIRFLLEERKQMSE